MALVHFSTGLIDIFHLGLLDFYTVVGLPPPPYLGDPLPHHTKIYFLDSGRVCRRLEYTKCRAPTVKMFTLDEQK